MDLAISNLKDIFKDDISTEELDIIYKANSYLSQQVPNNKVMLGDRSSEGVKIRSQVNYLIYKLKNKLIIDRVSHDDEYNKKFVTYTRMGRPSKAAIESEIYFSSKELSELKVSIDRMIVLVEYLEHLSNSVESYISILSSRGFVL